MTLVLSVDSRIDTFIDQGDPLAVAKSAGAVKREHFRDEYNRIVNFFITKY